MIRDRPKKNTGCFPNLLDYRLLLQFSQTYRKAGESDMGTSVLSLMFVFRLLLPILILFYAGALLDQRRAY